MSKPRKKICWGVETRKKGKKTVTIDYSKNTTAREAKEAYVRRKKKSWAQLEKDGAKVVKGEMLVWRERKS